MSFITFPGRCEFRDATGTTLLQGIRLKNLYQLLFHVILPATTISEANVALESPHSSITSDSVNSTHLSEVELWHHCMGHVNYSTLHQMFLADSVLDFTSKNIVSLVHPCPGCMYGKQHKATYTSDPLKQRSKIHGEFLHGDVSGKMNTPSLHGSLYYIYYIKMIALVIDLCTSPSTRMRPLCSSKEFSKLFNVILDVLSLDS